MNKQEACQILGVSPTATPEEIKKQYRKLCLEFHPDRNKDPSAADSFKKVNEANSFLTNPQPSEHNFGGGFDPFGRSPFRQQIRRIEHINLYTTISFKDSVFGIKKELKFNRQAKCKECDGDGEITLNNGCDKCGGKGVIISQQRGMIFQQTCIKCYGKTSSEACKICNESGIIETNVSIQISIPGGIVSGNILRLSGMGNFAGSFMNMDQYTDSHLHVTVTPEPGLRLEGQDVISLLDISLLEALQGCKKTVKTILGNREIEIKALSRNMQEVILPKLGVSKIGSQRVILDVKYPDDIENLIYVLTEDSKQKEVQ